MDLCADSGKIIEDIRFVYIEDTDGMCAQSQLLLTLFFRRTGKRREDINGQMRFIAEEIYCVISDHFHTAETRIIL